MRGDVAGDALVWTGRRCGRELWKMDVKKMVRQVGWGILRQSVQAWFQPELSICFSPPSFLV